VFCYMHGCIHLLESTGADERECGAVGCSPSGVRSDRGSAIMQAEWGPDKTLETKGYLRLIVYRLVM
jgi:hypothetical protein